MECNPTQQLFTAKRHCSVSIYPWLCPPSTNADDRNSRLIDDRALISPSWASIYRWQAFCPQFTRELVSERLCHHPILNHSHGTMTNENKKRSYEYSINKKGSLLSLTFREWISRCDFCLLMNSAIAREYSLSFSGPHSYISVMFRTTFAHRRLSVSPSHIQLYLSHFVQHIRVTIRSREPTLCRLIRHLTSPLKRSSAN